MTLSLEVRIVIRCTDNAVPGEVGTEEQAVRSVNQNATNHISHHFQSVARFTRGTSSNGLIGVTVQGLGFLTFSIDWIKTLLTTNTLIRVLVVETVVEALFESYENTGSIFQVVLLFTAHAGLEVIVSHAAVDARRIWTAFEIIVEEKANLAFTCLVFEIIVFGHTPGVCVSSLQALVEGGEIAINTLGAQENVLDSSFLVLFTVGDGLESKATVGNSEGLCVFVIAVDALVALENSLGDFLGHRNAIEVVGKRKAVSVVITLPKVVFGQTFQANRLTLVLVTSLNQSFDALELVEIVSGLALKTSLLQIRGVFVVFETLVERFLGANSFD